MAILTERNIVFVSKDSKGNTCLDYPLTKAEQVEDLESYVKEHSTKLNLPLSIANGGTGQTTVADVRNTLGLGNTTGALPVANGGTGATSIDAAIKALFGTSSIGSSTKPLYYNGAALKACADSIGGGGIVAQLLEQNGYVKFANGLILQWGYNNTNNNHFAFLLPYTAVPLVFAMGVGKGISLRDGYGRNADNITLNGFTTVSSPTDAYPIGWLSLGF